MTLRGGGRKDAAPQGLSLLAFAVCTWLLLLTLGANHGFAGRADREAWTIPQSSPDRTATAVQSTRTDFYDGRPITVVTLAALTASAPAPPGLPVFPVSGELRRSPALERLVRSDPRVLAHRWPGRVVGSIAAAGLPSPDALVVVVGARPTSPALLAPVAHELTGALQTAGPVPVSDFPVRAGSLGDSTYEDLAAIATVLLVIPLLVLGGGAARLGLARRDRRLGALRLVGASSRQILGMVAFESGAVALAGAVVGAMAYGATLPLLSRFSLGGGSFFASDGWVGLGDVVLVLLAVTAGGVLSAVVTLRRVLVTPLGVVQRHVRHGRHLWRVAAFVVAVVVYLRLSRSSGTSLASLVVAFGVAFAGLSILGPGVVAVLGRVMVVGARGPARLLAGRRLLDDPAGAWRVVGGLALTGFVAGFLALIPSSNGQVVFGSAGAIDIAVPASQVQQRQSTSRGALLQAGLSGDVRISKSGGALAFTRLGRSSGRGDRPGFLSVPVASRDRERTRTVLERALPGQPLATGTDVAARDDLLDRSVHRASLLVLIASFLVAIASAGITACASVLDRGATYRALHLTGVPLELIDGARRRETGAPLLVLVLGSLVTGVVCAAPLTRFGLGGGQLDRAGLALLAATVALGLIGVRSASAASRQLLRAVIADPATRST